jgi:hypothetical protein
MIRGDSIKSGRSGNVTILNIQTDRAGQLEGCSADVKPFYEVIDVSLW